MTKVQASHLASQTQMGESQTPLQTERARIEGFSLFLLLFFFLSICELRPLDMFSLCSNSIYCRYAPIRYEINPSFAQQAYRVRQHISNAIGVYRKSREGFISMRDTPLRVSRYLPPLFLHYSSFVKSYTPSRKCRQHYPIGYLLKYRISVG